MTTRRKISLKTLCYAVVALSVVMPMLAFALIGRMAYARLFENAIELQTEELHELKANIEHEVGNVVVLMQSKSDFIAHGIAHGGRRDAFDAGLVAGAVDSLFGAKESVSSATVFDRSGRLIAHRDRSSPADIDVVDHDFADILTSPWFVVPMHGHRYQSASFPYEGRRVFLISFPIGDVDSPSGVFIATLDVGKIWRGIQEHIKEREALIYVVDGRGVLLSSSPEVDRPNGGLMTDIEPVRALIAKKDWDGKSSYVGLGGEMVHAATASLESLDMGVVSEITVKNMTGPIIKALAPIATIGLATLFVCAAAGVWITRRLFMPMDVLSATLGRVSAGDYSAAMPGSAVKELDALASAFNAMSLELKARDRYREEKNDLLQAIAMAHSLFLSEFDTNASFDKLLGTILSTTGSEYGFIGRVLRTKDGAPYLKTFATTDISWNDATREFYARNAPAGLEFHNMKTLFGAVITSGKPVISNNPSSDPRAAGIPEGHPPLNAFLGLPFYRRGELIGMLGIANRAGGYDEGVVEFLKPFTYACECIIDAFNNNAARKAAEDALKESQNLLLSVIDNSAVLVYMKDLDGRYMLVNRWYEKIVGVARDEIKGKTDQHLFPKEQADAFRSNDVEVVKKNEPLRFEEIVFHDGEPHTYVSIKFPIRDVDGRINAVCGVSTDITERKKMEDELHVLATTDTLTGAYNRKKMDEILDMEVERARRFSHPLSALLFDIDYFKQINDAHGHAVGDMVLRAIAGAVKGQMRKTNYFIRWGGEEFLIIAVETDIDGAVNLAERIKNAVAALRFDDVKGGVTASFGVTQFKPDDTVDSFLKRADDALYKAKHEGRNRIVASS
jgi:diguanylate cyclase (GGDEF)-like protein/PAS domain S-box-containing protein